MSQPVHPPLTQRPPVPTGPRFSPPSGRAAARYVTAYAAAARRSIDYMATLAKDPPRSDAALDAAVDGLFAAAHRAAVQAVWNEASAAAPVPLTGPGAAAARDDATVEQAALDAMVDVTAAAADAADARRPAP